MKKYILIFAAASAAFCAFAESNPINPPKLVGSRGENYDESKTNLFPIPDILELPGGKGKIETALDWETYARPYVIKQLEEQMYGAMPPAPRKPGIRAS